MMRAIFYFLFAVMICFPISVKAEVTDCPKECLNVEGRMEQERCAAKVLGAAEKELDKYILESKKSNKDNPAVVKAIDDAQRRWLDFRKSACKVYSETWGNGTGRGVATYACQIDLTRRWTHLIWEYFSPGMKGGKGGLPEPKTGGE
jgi:uncharacterized protein YecT (DUF1311 family)